MGSSPSDGICGELMLYLRIRIGCRVPIESHIMDALADFKANLLAVAERSAIIKSNCDNEEGTKQFLVLPVIAALGYDCSNPFEVQPEFPADFRNGMQERVDYVIMCDGKPAIAVECKKVGADLAANRGQLRSYFTPLSSVRLGILTDGIRFEFFVDCEDPNVMDAEPFVTLDLEQATRSPIPDDVIEALSQMSRANFSPDTIADAAEMRLISKRLRTALTQEFRDPSDDLCKLVLQRVGVTNVRRASIQARYSGLIKAAMEDALILPVVELLKGASGGGSPSDSKGEVTQRTITTERELSVYRYICRRLAFLSADERHFSAIEHVGHRDYIGKFAIYYANVKKGRLLDFIEGSNGQDKFIFPEPFGELVTGNIRDIDDPLRKIFAQRVRELGAPVASPAMLLKTA